MKSEFEFLKNLKQSFNLERVGDDCAVLPKDSRSDLVITSDLLVEDIDFRREWMIPEFLGHKALAVSLSDIAAMGAKPVWAMLSIGIPEDIWKTDFVDEFYEGWFKLANKFDVELIGGDVSKAPEKIFIDSIAGGDVRKGNAIKRSGAQSGDLIFVTGVLGGASAGLSMLNKGVTYRSDRTESPENQLILRQLRPTPRTELGEILGESDLATAMIDLSDGLSSDLFHVCTLSQTGARIFRDKLPLDENIGEISSENLDILDLALNGGEDFELLFSANPSDKKKILENISSFESVQISLIGEITETPEKLELISKNSSRILSPKGFRHF